MKSTLHSTPGQTGYTLIEVLVAILISSIMLGVALNQLIGSRQLFALQEADSRIEENARYALEILTSNIKLASFSDINDGSQNLVTGQFFSFTCAGFSPCTADGASTDSDRFAVWYNPPSSAEQACDGTALTGTNATNSVVNLFYIALDNTTSINNLRCRSYSINSSNTATLISGSDRSIIEGIDNIQIQYGITDRSETSNLPVRYLSANSIAALPTNSSLKDKWASIVSARVTILVNAGYSDGTDPAASRTYSLSDSPPITLTDGNRRKVFSSTVAINNANI